MRVGIVGFGKMGMLHGALVNLLEGMELVAIADSSRPVLRAFRSVTPRLSYYPSGEEMIRREKLEAVVITTPSFSHVPLARSAVGQRLHLLIEKPLSNTAKGAEELARAVREREVAVLVGFCMRYMPTFARVKEIAAGGALGRPLTGSARVYIADVFGPQKGWRFKREASGGGVVIEYAIHMLDLLQWYFGPAGRVRGRARQLYSLEVEDEFEGELFFENGLRVELEASWSKPEYRKAYARLTLSFERGSVEVTEQSLMVKGPGGTEEFYYPDLYGGCYADIGGLHYSLQMEAFRDLAGGARLDHCGVTEALLVQRLVEACYRAAESGGEVSP